MNKLRHFVKYLNCFQCKIIQKAFHSYGKVICKSQNGELGNEMKGMQGVGAGMQG